MLTLPGTYTDGRIEFLQDAPKMNGAKVLVTFLEPDSIDLKTRGIDEAQAADLRGRLKAFAEDWDRPEDDIYDQPPAR